MKFSTAGVYLFVLFDIGQINQIEFSNQPFYFLLQRSNSELLNNARKLSCLKPIILLWKFNVMMWRWLPVIEVWKMKEIIRLNREHLQAHTLRRSLLSIFECNDVPAEELIVSSRLDSRLHGSRFQIIEIGWWSDLDMPHQGAVQY